MSGITMSLETPIFFLTSLGLGNYRELQYGLGEQTYATRFAPVATAALVFSAAERQQMNVRILCTAKARDHCFDQVAREFHSLGVSSVAWREVPEAQSASDFQKILTAILEVVPDNEQVAVAVDVTLGFRHLPFIYVAALTYLVALRGVTFRGLFYAAGDLERPNGAHSIVDVSRFFELIRWHQALAALRDTGRARPLARILRQHVGNLFSAENDVDAGRRQISVIRDAAEKLAAPLSSGLPIEAGIAAGQLLRAVQSAAGSNADTGILAASQLAKHVEGWALPPQVKDKENIELTKEELRRQWLFSRWLFEHDDYGNCLEVLREWVVNLVLFRQGVSRNWLNYEQRRKPAERFLAAIAYRARSGLNCAAEHERLASFWAAISEKRNLLAHAGMKAETVKLPREPLQHLVFVEARQLLESVDTLEVRFGGTRNLLVSALGRSPGALFTALSHLRPDAAIVLTSEQASLRLPDTLKAADMPNLEVQPIVLQDPYRAFREAASVIAQCRPSLLSADRVVVNLTGGTTAMQYLAERVADEAKRLGIHVERVAVLDERPTVEQQADPFKLGAIEFLDEVVGNSRRESP